MARPKRTELQTKQAALAKLRERAAEIADIAGSATDAATLLSVRQESDDMPVMLLAAELDVVNAELAEKEAIQPKAQEEARAARHGLAPYEAEVKAAQKRLNEAQRQASDINRATLNLNERIRALKNRRAELAHEIRLHSSGRIVRHRLPV